MTSGIGAARGAEGRSFASLGLLKTWLALFFATSLSLTTVAPAFAVTSSSAAPALAGLPAAPAPRLESSGEGAANVSPYDVNNASSGLMSLMSGGDEPKSAKFEPPETPYNGAFTRSLPVEVPPFFEITPKIKLNYNSGDNRQHAGDGFSILGVGWTMSGGGLIERKSSRGGLPRFDATDAFELDGNPLMDCVVEGVTRQTPSCSAGGTHTARYETYERIKRSGTLNSWEVTARDGTVSTYKALGSFAPAGTEDARLRNDYRWLLASVTDTDGNTISYSYDCSALPTCYVSTISYGTSSIQFYWETRTDSFTYATGISLANATKRLKTIAVRTGTSLIRAYAVGYTISPDTKRSLLSSFKQHGSDATVATGTGVISGGTSLPADTFTYWDMTSRRMGTMISDLVTANTAVEGTPSTTATEPIADLIASPRSGAQNLVGDFNGDKRTDLIVVAGTSTTCRLHFYGAGEFDAPSNEATIVTDVNGLSPIVGCSSSNFFAGDFNGDGKDDVATASTIASPNADSYGYPKEPYRTQLASQGYVVGDQAWAVIFLEGMSIVGGAVTGLGVHGSTPSVGLRNSSQASKALVADFNGDGKDDIFRGDVYVSNGHGFDRQVWANQDWGRIGDYNADGLADMFVLDGVNGVDSRLLLSTGSGFESKPLGLTVTNRPDYYWPEFDAAASTYNSGTALGYWFAGDWNGDGASDWAQSRSDVYRYDSAGSTFIKTASPTGSWPSGLANDGADVNGDGRTDPRSFNGNNDAVVLVRSGDNNVETFVWPNISGPFGNVGDWNGDGRTDTRNGTTIYTDSVLPDLLKQQRLSAGGTVDAEYLPSPYWSNGYLPMVLQVVSKVTTTDGRGNSSSTKYAYEGGAYDPFERKFLGFAKVTAELPCEVGETTCPWMHSWYRQEAVAAGSLSKSEVYAPNGQILRKLENGYVVNQTAAPFTAHKTSEEVTDYLVGGNTVTRREWTYDGYANLLEEKDLGVIASTADDVITQSTYQLNLTNYLVSFATAVTVRDASSAILRDAQLYYDGATSVATAPTKGHVTTTRNWLNPGNRWIAATSSYDTYGNLVAQVDALGNRTEIDYDATHQYATEARNPLWFDGDTRQKTSVAWNAICGAPSSSTDLNGLVTTYQYDALCRPTRTDYPTTDYVTTTYVNIGNATTQYVESARKPADGVNLIWSRAYFDGLGRAYKATTVSADPLKPIVTETAYAKRGQPVKSTALYYQGDTPQWTTTKFDVLGRPQLVTLPDNATIGVAYEWTPSVPGATKVTTTDPLGRVTNAILNARGDRIADVALVAGTVARRTDYRYSPLSELVGVTDPNGNVWSNSYDTLGRRLSSSDPDLGTWTYAYDDLGRPSTQVDAKGQQTVITYDRLSRVLTRIAGYGLPIEDTNTSTYDEARSGYFNVGALTTTANDNATISYDYDRGGRTVQQKTTVDGVVHTVASSFDAGGRLLSRTYPDGSTSGTFAYNAAGQMTTLSGAITGTTYAADGQIKSTSYANGVATTYGYSSARGWLSSISAVKGATVIESLTYGRDSAGRITSVTGGRADESWTYGYDTFDQLLSAANTNTPSLSRTYSYDVGGNLTSNSAIGTYSYPTQGATAYQPHAVMSAGNWTFGYDLNGNQTTRHTGAMLDREIIYDADNRPISVTVGANTVAYLYGPDGARIKKLFGADETLYLGDDIERDSTGAFTNYLTADVKRVGGANHFLQVDHQSSTRAVTDNAGALYRASAFEPFGKQIETVLNPLTPAEGRGYIGERTDPENGLTYLHARYYDTSLGRFLQPDWWDVRNSGVGTNRYAYSGNSPINRADPGGHVFAEEATRTSATRVVTVTTPAGNSLRVATSNPETISRAASQAATRAGAAVVAGTSTGVSSAGPVARSLMSSEGGSGSGLQITIPAPPRVVRGVLVFEVIEWGLFGGSRNLAPHNDRVFLGPGDFVVTQEKANPVPETVGPGKNAKGSIPAGPTLRPSQGQQEAIDELGNEHGCHTCGSNTPGTASGRWVGDHQPPTALRGPTEPQVYYPQCLSCSQRKGGYVRGITRED